MAATGGYNYKRLAIRKKRRCRKCFQTVDRKIKTEFSKEPKLLPDSQLEEAWEDIDQEFSKELGFCVSPKKEEGESQEEEEESDSDLDDNTRAQLRKCRCRQGRSAESRRKVKLEAQKIAWDPNRDVPLKIESVCPDPNCGGKELVMDYREDQAICIMCGAICEDIIPCVDFDNTPLKARSKPYTTPVYAHEKLRALNNSDPPIWDEEWELITDMARNLYGFDFKSHLERTMGPRTFGRICKSVVDQEGNAILANKKYGERWIQVGIPFPFSPKRIRPVIVV